MLNIQQLTTPFTKMGREGGASLQVITRTAHSVSSNCLLLVHC